MARISEIGGPTSPLSALLKEGLTQLSGDQHVTFHLYRKFVSPLDGLVYWVRVLQGSEGARVVVTDGLVHETIRGGESIQCVPGGIGAADILGGRIVNPATAADQGLSSRMEPLFIDLTGPADEKPGYSSTTQLMPGDGFDLPDQPEYGAWVSSPAAGHRFHVSLRKLVSSLSGQPLTIEQAGSLHYASLTEQEADAVIDTNTVVFTSKDEVKPFNLISPDELYIGERDDIRFSFSSRGNYYEAADLWHYMGQALFSVNKPLIIDNPVGWRPDVFVTNSLPIWLTMPGYVPPYPGLICPLAVFPSYLAPDNTPTPFASIHVEETHGLQPTPMWGRRMQHSQLAKDIVKVTLYGASARVTADFMDFVLQFSTDEGLIGILEMPVVMRDEHRTQPEFQILAQKKVIEFEISYQQAVARDMARQVIEKAVVQFYDASTGEPIVQNAEFAIG